MTYGSFMGKIGAGGKDISAQHCQRQNTARFSNYFFFTLIEPVLLDLSNETS